MAELLNTLLYALQSAQNANLQRQQREQDLARETSGQQGRFIYDAAQQQMAREQAAEEARKKQAFGVGEAATLAGEAPEWDYAADVQPEGEYGELAGRATLAKSEAARRANEELARIAAASRENVAKTRASAPRKPSAEYDRFALATLQDLQKAAEGRVSRAVAEIAKLDARPPWERDPTIYNAAQQERFDAEQEQEDLQAAMYRKYLGGSLPARRTPGAGTPTPATGTTPPAIPGGRKPITSLK